MKFPKILKNKYLIALCIFLVYFLFLDDIDVFTLYSQIKTKNKLQEQNKAMKAQLVQKSTSSPMTKKSLSSFQKLRIKRIVQPKIREIET